MGRALLLLAWAAAVTGASAADAVQAPAASAASATPAAPVAPIGAYQHLHKYVTGEANAAPLELGGIRPRSILVAQANCAQSPVSGAGVCTGENRGAMGTFQYVWQRCTYDKPRGAAFCEIVATDHAVSPPIKDLEVAALYYQRSCDMGGKVQCRRALDAMAAFRLQVDCDSGQTDACAKAAEMVRKAYRGY